MAAKWYPVSVESLTLNIQSDPFVARKIFFNSSVGSRAMRVVADVTVAYKHSIKTLSNLSEPGIL